MSRTRPALLTLAALLALAAAPAGEASVGVASTTEVGPTPAACAAPEELLEGYDKLSELGARLKPGASLDVLAVGSATMLGPRGGGEGSFPYRMAELLRAAAPGANVRLTVHSGRGLTASDMLATLRKELAVHPYQLVLWQTGTVEAVRNLPPEEFSQTLAEGIQLARDAGGFVVLIDPQFSRFLRANANLDPYQQTLQQAASLPGVALFHRFDLMRNWASSGQIDLERAGRFDRQKTADLLHDCLGRALAHLVLGGTAAASRP